MQLTVGAERGGRSVGPRFTDRRGRVGRVLGGIVQRRRIEDARRQQQAPQALVTVLRECAGERQHDTDRTHRALGLSERQSRDLGEGRQQLVGLGDPLAQHYRLAQLIEGDIVARNALEPGRLSKRRLGPPPIAGVECALGQTQPDPRCRDVACHLVRSALEILGAHGSQQSVDLVVDLRLQAHEAVATRAQLSEPAQTLYRVDAQVGQQTIRVDLLGVAEPREAQP